jgi:hypothetical protein
MSTASAALTLGGLMYPVRGSRIGGCGMFISIGIISSPPFIIDIIMGSIGFAPCCVVVVPDIIIINGKIFEISSSPLGRSIFICWPWLTFSA